MWHVEGEGLDVLADALQCSQASTAREGVGVEVDFDIGEQVWRDWASSIAGC